VAVSRGPPKSPTAAQDSILRKHSRIRPPRVRLLNAGRSTARLAELAQSLIKPSLFGRYKTQRTSSGFPRNSRNSYRGRVGEGLAKRGTCGNQRLDDPGVDIDFDPDVGRLCARLGTEITAVPQSSREGTQISTGAGSGIRAVTFAFAPRPSEPISSTRVLSCSGCIHLASLKRRLSSTLCSGPCRAASSKSLFSWPSLFQSAAGSGYWARRYDG